eukprot:NODE_6536_length_1663_cov_5.477865.p1 GENE.NODE_6536_length_1663_cov_5.477865~~NODE_6536_length_1663_cov_5.477865.p1  ORF type:complete len:437 (-),score=146.36 NODE_6536_length_1663_cov_5.477865:50-1360(-)
MKRDLADTKDALEEDTTFLANLDKHCGEKGDEWDERKKTRAEEIQAIAETITVLNDDDALDLFKKTLPSPGDASFVQSAKAEVLATRALRIIKALPLADVRGPRPELDFLALSIQKGKASPKFDKVLKQIDAMVAHLAVEQTDDDQKKQYCHEQFDTAEDQLKALTRKVAGLAAILEEAREVLKTTIAELKSLETGIATLDKEVKEAVQQRKEEHADFTDLIASDAAAKKLMEFAKNRLNKFYNPSLYKPPQEQELSAQQRISVNMGAEAAPTVAPSGIAGTGITVLQKKDAPPPPPETYGAYHKKGEESTGVIAMIDLLIKDLNKEMTEAKSAEEHAQATYEEMITNSKEKRRQDAKSLELKLSAKAAVEGEIAEHSDAKASKDRELKDTLKYISTLHGECDWILQYFDMRKEARVNEADQLKQAKAVLSGADFS